MKVKKQKKPTVLPNIYYMYTRRSSQSKRPPADWSRDFIFEIYAFMSKSFSPDPPLPPARANNSSSTSVVLIRTQEKDERRRGGREVYLLLS